MSKPLINEIWDRFIALENMILEESDPSEVVTAKLDELGKTLDKVDGVLEEAEEASTVEAPEQRRLNMWLGDLEELGRKLHSTHGYSVTLEEVINHLKQWDKRCT